MLEIRNELDRIEGCRTEIEEEINQESRLKYDNKNEIQDFNGNLLFPISESDITDAITTMLKNSY